MRGLGNFLQRRRKRLDSTIDLRSSDDQRRLETNDITIDATDPDQYAPAQKPIADGFRFGGGRRQLFVFDQFDANHKA